jgi:hypothetical protein
MQPCDDAAMGGPGQGRLHRGKCKGSARPCGTLDCGSLDCGSLDCGSLDCGSLDYGSTCTMARHEHAMWLPGLWLDMRMNRIRVAPCLGAESYACHLEGTCLSSAIWLSRSRSVSRTAFRSFSMSSRSSTAMATAASLAMT